MAFTDLIPEGRKTMIDEATKAAVDVVRARAMEAITPAQTASEAILEALRETQNTLLTIQSKCASISDTCDRLTQQIQEDKPLSTSLNIDLTQSVTALNQASEQLDFILKRTCE